MAELELRKVEHWQHRQVILDGLSMKAPSGRITALLGDEESGRLTALKGAEVLLFPTAIGWHPSEKEESGEQQLDAWRTIQRSHAIANGVFVAAPNRVGHETPLASSPHRPTDYQGIEFWGGSFVCDPSGVVLAEAPRDREAVLVAEIDLDRVDDVRRNWPFMRDRRVDAYEGLQSRYLGCGQ